tara:strand:+ start:314 stop:553 length:240 start_codon:yes stop_codon:yes gene_type:complete
MWYVGVFGEAGITTLVFRTVRSKGEEGMTLEEIKGYGILPEYIEDRLIKNSLSELLKRNKIDENEGKFSPRTVRRTPVL